MRRAGDAGLRWLADCGLPHFFRGCSIDGYQAAVAGADVHFAVPNGHAAIDARGIGTIDGLVQANLRIEFPQQFSRGSLHRIDFRKRRADINHSIHNDRLRYDAHGAFNVQRPGQTQPSDIFVGDLLQRAEMAGVKSAAVEKPVVPSGGVGHDTRLVHVPGLRFVVRGRAKRNSHPDRDNDEGQTENAPWIHVKPPFE